MTTFIDSFYKLVKNQHVPNENDHSHFKDLQVINLSVNWLTMKSSNDGKSAMNTLLNNSHYNL